MTVLIDADGCPVVKEAAAAAANHNADCVIVCDTSHSISVGGAKTVTVDKGADSADFKVVNLAQRGDIVITQDYGLAAMCLARECVVLNQDGMRYDDSNIDALLAARANEQKLRRAGKKLKGPSARTAAQDKTFAEALERELNSGNS